MPDKLVLRGALPTDNASDTTLSEEGVRQALARLGRGGNRDAGVERSPEQGREQVDPFRHTGGGSSNANQRRTAQTPMHKLKRPAFVQDGDVVVEYAGRDRQSGHHEADQGRSALDALRDEVARERRSREESERALTEGRLALQTVQTRLAHLEIDLNEARSALRKAQDDAAAAAVERPEVVAAEPEPEPAPVIEPVVSQPAPSVPKVRRLQAKPRTGTREPQPVKWWIKSKG